MDEIKAMLQSLVDSALKAKNKADDEEEEEIAENENIDKRKLIDEVGGILKGKVDEEVWRTIIGKIEKVAYEGSETDKADNEDEEKKEAKNKAKCKNEDEEKEEKYEEFKKEVAKEAENKKAKNSLDAIKKIFFEGEVKNSKPYMSQKEGIELGKELY